jgi:hypothetical protein
MFRWPSHLNCVADLEIPLGGKEGLEVSLHGVRIAERIGQYLHYFRAYPPDLTGLPLSSAARQCQQFIFESNSRRNHPEESAPSAFHVLNLITGEVWR